MIALTSFLLYVLFEKDLGSNEETTTDEIYATDITITANFRSLSLYVGNSLKFSENPYTVTPANYNQGVEIKILDNLGKEKEGATFIDNCFTPLKTGAFYLKFIVKTKYNTFKQDTIKISVLDKPDESYKSVILNQDAKVISLNEVLDVSEFVSVYNLGKSELKYNASNGRMDGSVFVPNGVGSCTIDVVIDNGDYLIYNTFTVIVSTKENIDFLLYDITNTKIENGERIICSLDKKILMFSYMIEGFSSQLITVEIKNEEIVSLISSDAPIIIFKLVGVGETEIIIRIPNKAYEFKLVLLVE